MHKLVPKVDVVITVEDAHRATIAAVARRLRAAGLGASQTLATAGIITGCVARDEMAGLEKVTGVRAVEASCGVQIPPPGSEIQ